MRKSFFFFLFLIASAGLSLFAYNLIRVSQGQGGRVTDEELRKALVADSHSDQKSLSHVLSKIAENPSQHTPSQEPFTARREIASQTPVNGTEVHQLSTQEVFSQLRDRIDGRMGADQNVLLGLMARLQSISEPTPEVSEFVLGEMLSFRAKKYFEDRGMAARYLQTAAIVFMQSTGDADRTSESMVRVVTQQEDPELRRILALTYLERNQDRRDTFIKQLEAKGIANVLSPLTGAVTPASDTPSDPESGQL